VSYLLLYGITVDALSSNNYARVSHTSYNLWHAQVVYFCSLLLNWFFWCCMGLRPWWQEINITGLHLPWVLI